MVSSTTYLTFTAFKQQLVSHLDSDGTIALPERATKGLIEPGFVFSAVFAAVNRRVRRATRFADGAPWEPPPSIVLFFGVQVRLKNLSDRHETVTTGVSRESALGRFQPTLDRWAGRSHALRRPRPPATRWALLAADHNRSGGSRAAGRNSAGC